MNCGIYTIISPSGSCYIGSAVNIERRWHRHRKDLRARIHGNRPLQRAADKYGIQNLAFVKLVICRPQDLLVFEQIAIDGLLPEYNVARIAGSCIGIKRTPEFRQKISAALTRRVVSAETRAKIGDKHRGKTITAEQLKAMRDGLAKKPPSKEQLRKQAKAMHTPEAKAKKALAMIGHPTSSETRAKISAALKGRPHSPARIAAILAGKARAASVQQDGS